jgi:hypothetical protein
MNNANLFIRLPDEQKDWLEDYSERKQLNQSNCVRKALLMLEQQDKSQRYLKEFDSDAA